MSRNACALPTPLLSFAFRCCPCDPAPSCYTAAGLATNGTVTVLDLSHNKVADRGVKALAKLLGPTAVLVSLDLCDNHVHADGGKYLGRALRVNSSLQVRAQAWRVDSITIRCARAVSEQSQ